MKAAAIKYAWSEEGHAEQSTSQTNVTLIYKEDPTWSKSEKKYPVIRSPNLLRKLHEAFQKLHGVFQESNIPGWDGENAEPVADATFYNAARLLSAIPLSLPVPDILADNDGYIEFEWYKEGKSFSLYVTDTNLVLYAGFYGKEDRLSGRFNFEGVFSSRVEFFAKDVYKEKAQ